MKREKVTWRQGMLLALMQILLRGAAVSFQGYVSGKIGAESMGLFTLVMSIYGFAVTVATSSVQLAAVRLTAERCAKIMGTDRFSHRRTVQAILRAVCRYALCFGMGAGVLLFALSRPISIVLLHDERTLSSLRVLALSLPAIALTSAFGGYFTGMRKVEKNAAMTLLEQVAKFCITATALVAVVPTRSVEGMCLAVVGGSAAAEGLSLVTAVILYSTDSRVPKGEQMGAKHMTLSTCFKEVFAIAFPVAIGSYARQGLVTAEHLAIPWGLRRAGIGAGEALAAYGVLQGMALPVLLFPYAVIGAFTGILIPEITALYAVGEEGELRRLGKRSITTALWFSLLCMLVFFVLAEPLGNRIYHSAEAGTYIRRLAFLVPFMYLDTVTDALLKGLGEQVYCMKVNMLDALCSLMLVVVCTPIWGLDGYIVSLYACEIVNLGMSAWKLWERLGEKKKKKLPDPI